MEQGSLSDGRGSGRVSEAGHRSTDRQRRRTGLATLQLGQGGHLLRKRQRLHQLGDAPREETRAAER